MFTRFSFSSVGLSKFLGALKGLNLAVFFRRILPYSYSEETAKTYLILDLLKFDSSGATVTDLISSRKAYVYPGKE